MATHIKVNGMAFSIHAELLREELAQTYTQKAVDYVNKNIHRKNIINPVNVESVARIFLRRAEQEYERRLYVDFPDPVYDSYIGLTCLGSTKFFDRLQETIPAAINHSLSQKDVELLGQ